MRHSDLSEGSFYVHELLSSLIDAVEGQGGKSSALDHVVFDETFLTAIGTMIAQRAKECPITRVRFRAMFISIPDLLQRCGITNVPAEIMRLFESYHGYQRMGNVRKVFQLLPVGAPFLQHQSPTLENFFSWIWEMKANIMPFHVLLPFLGPQVHTHFLCASPGLERIELRVLSLNEARALENARRLVDITPTWMND